MNTPSPEESLAAAVAHQRAGRFAQALAIYDALLTEHPHRPDILQMRGLLDLERGDAAKAHAWLSRAAIEAPGSGSIQINLAMTCAMLGRLDAARRAYERAGELLPGHPRPRLGLAGVLRSLGEVDRAEAVLREVLGRHPGEAEAIASLAEIRLGRGHAEQAEALLRRALALPSLEARVRGSLLFILGRLLDGAGRFDEAFAAASEANRLRAKSYDADAMDRLADRVISIFDAGLIARLAPLGDSTDRPVFIVGMPRSGTSLTEQIIQMHDGVAAGGERIVMHQAAQELPGLLGSASRYPDCMADATEANWSNAAKRVAELACALDPDAARITDKLPSNFIRVGLIATALPGAAIVHCVRDPRDTCLSAYFQDFFGQTIAASTDLRNLGRYYRSYARLMRHWKGVLGDRVLDLAYEDLVTEPEASTRRLMTHVGLPWNAACLRFHQSDRFVPTASAQQVKRPMYTSSVGRWKHYERHLAPLIEALGDEIAH